jgi:hypothetical protein
MKEIKGQTDTKPNEMHLPFDGSYDEQIACIILMLSRNWRRCVEPKRHDSMTLRWEGCSIECFGRSFPT